MTKPLLKKLVSSQLRLNILSGSVATGLGALVSAVKYPLYLHFLGYENYGVWLLLSSILIFAQMGLLGITPAIIKLVSEEYGKKNTTAIQEYFRTALCLLAGVGVVLVAISVFFKWQIIGLMGLKGANSIIAADLLIYMVIFSVEVLAYQVVNSVLAGLGRIDIANYSQTALQVLPLLISIPLLVGNIGIVSLLLANAFAYSSILFLNLVQLKRKIKIKSSVYFSRKRLTTMIQFGFPVFSGSMLSMMVVPTTKIIITRTIGLEIVPIFELAYRIAMQVRSLFEVALRALMPEISKLAGSGGQEDKKKIKQIIGKAYKLLVWGAIPIYAVLFVFADVIFKIWLGSNFTPPIPLAFRIMLISTATSLAGVVPYYNALGKGLTKTIFTHHFLNACGTMLSIVVLVNSARSINLSMILWCFTLGSTVGTGYLFLTKSK